MNECRNIDGQCAKSWCNCEHKWPEEIDRLRASLGKCAQRLKEYAEADRAVSGVWTDPDEFIHGVVDEAEILLRPNA